jgi:AcrR family transcriptional regulator
MARDTMRKKNKRRRAEQVLDAAQELFRERGYEATRIERIAELASVAPATVYNYFTSKQNILMELALRHVNAALPERRAFLCHLPDDPIEGIIAFERLLSEQALRHLSRECWRVIMSGQYLDPRGKAGRAGARLGNLVKRHYIELIRAYQSRGRLSGSVDPVALTNLIVGVTTSDFGHFVSRSGGSVADLRRTSVSHIHLILAGLTMRGPKRRCGVNSKSFIASRATRS